MNDIDITKLPVSQLLRLAVWDACQCENDPKYTLDMTNWHLSHHEDGTCHVCMAGAVMAKTMKLSIDSYQVPTDYSSDIRKTLNILDDTRIGYYSGLPYGACLLIRGSYDHNINRAPWSTYLAVADMLEEDGL